jgi:hypothetical protein
VLRRALRMSRCLGHTLGLSNEDEKEKKKHEKKVVIQEIIR